MMESRGNVNAKVRMIDGIVFPGEYVATEVVEQIYKSSKGYNYFLCVSKESDVESRGGSFSRLSLPMSEMRQKRNDVCRELFGDKNLKSLNTSQRIRLAKTLKNRHESSVKQITRLCGLCYDEVKSLLE